jgi:hypothetical protein
MNVLKYIKNKILQIFFRIYFKNLLKYYRVFLFFFYGVKKTDTILQIGFKKTYEAPVTFGEDAYRKYLKKKYKFIEILDQNHFSDFSIPLYKIFFILNRFLLGRTGFLKYKFWFGNTILKPTSLYLKLLFERRTFNFRGTFFPRKVRKLRVIEYHIVFLQKYLYLKICFEFLIKFFFSFILTLNVIDYFLFFDFFFFKFICCLIFNIAIFYHFYFLSYFLKNKYKEFQAIYIGLYYLFFKNYNSNSNFFLDNGTPFGVYMKDRLKGRIIKFKKILDLYASRIFYENSNKSYFINKRIKKKLDVEIVEKKKNKIKTEILKGDLFFLLFFFNNNWIYFRDYDYHDEDFFNNKDYRKIFRSNLKKNKKEILKVNFTKYLKEKNAHSYFRRTWWSFLKKKSKKNFLREKKALNTEYFRLEVLKSNRKLTLLNLFFSYKEPFRLQLIKKAERNLKRMLAFNEGSFFFFRILNLFFKENLIIFFFNIKLKFNTIRLSNYLFKYKKSTNKNENIKIFHFLNFFFSHKKNLYLTTLHTVTDLTSINYLKLIKNEKKINNIEKYLNGLDVFLEELICLKTIKLSQETKNSIIENNKKYFLLITLFLKSLHLKKIHEITDLNLFKYNIEIPSSLMHDNLIQLENIQYSFFSDNFISVGGEKFEEFKLNLNINYYPMLRSFRKNEENSKEIFVREKEIRELLNFILNKDGVLSFIKQENNIKEKIKNKTEKKKKNNIKNRTKLDINTSNNYINICLIEKLKLEYQNLFYMKEILKFLLLYIEENLKREKNQKIIKELNENHDLKLLILKIEKTLEETLNIDLKK